MGEKKLPTIGWKNHRGEGADFELRSVYDLIDLVRQMPGLFVGEPTLTGLWHFINGFWSGLGSVGRDFEEDDPPFRDFHEFIADRFGESSSSRGWCQILLDHLGNEEKAFERFFTEVHEFRRVRAHSSE